MLKLKVPEIAPRSVRKIPVKISSLPKDSKPGDLQMTLKLVSNKKREVDSEMPKITELNLNLNTIRKHLYRILMAACNIIV